MVPLTWEEVRESKGINLHWKNKGDEVRVRQWLNRTESTGAETQNGRDVERV